MLRRFFVVLAVGALAAACSEKPGIGTAPRIRVVPTSHAFASVAVGQTDTLRVTITNIGGGVLDVSGVELASTSSSDFSIPTPPGLPQQLGANQSFAFEVAYRPQNVGADSGRVEIRSSDPASPVVNVDLRTLEIGPDISVEPALLDFGTVPRNQTQALTATIRNDGFADLIIDNIVAGTGSDFKVVQPATIPLTLTPGNTTELRVTYTPTGCAADQDLVQLFSNDPDEVPFTVTVKGRPPGPAIGAEPATVNFGAVNLGSPTDETVTFKNVGTTDLTISSFFPGIGTDPAFTIAAPSGQVVLAPNQTADVKVTFNPTVAGIARGALVASSDDCDNPQFQVPLEGVGSEGPAPLIQITPATINFGNVAANQSMDRTFDVVSIGQLPLNVTSIARESGTSGEFTVVNGGSGFSLSACPTPPCPKQTITVRYTPTGPGSDNGNLIVASNAVNDPNAKVQLIGNGLEGATCVLRARPTTLNYQGVLLGTFKDLAVTLSNEGTGNCTYDKTEFAPLTQLQGFFIQSQPGVGQVIAPGQSRQVVIRFQPPSLGPRFGLAFVNWNDPNAGGAAGQGSPATITLLGESTEPDIEAIPAALDFGIITVGCASQILTVKVFNTGSAPLTITNIRLQNSPSKFQIIQAPAPNTQVAGGTFIEVKLRYVPTGVGSDTDNLVIESDDADEPTTLVPLTGQGTTVTDVIDKFTQATDPMVDILFVIDNSGSMSEEQQNLRTNFNTIAQIATSQNVDYHIGVVTTDEPRLRGNPKIITRSVADPVAAFDANANVGSSGSGTEPGLEMAKQALSEPLISSDNAGFLRQDASLEVVVVSDEEDQSSQSVDFYVTFFYSIKGAQNTSLFRFSAIAGDVPNGCGSSAGNADAGRRYQEVANRTGGVFGSICDASFAQTLSAIGSGAFALRVQFFLSRQPDTTQPITVRQYANEAACDADTTFTGGTVIPQNPNTGWSYDAQTNSVIFGPQAVPPRGACMKVKYKAACIPP